MQSIIVAAVYLGLTLLIGLLASKRGSSADSFHGQNLGIISIVFASAGEWLGGTATSGVAEYGFTYGISGAWYTVANGLGVLFLAIFFAKLFRSIGVGTIPGIIDHFFGGQARKVSCCLLVFVMLVVGLSQMIAAGKLGQALLGLDFRVSVVIFAVVFIAFTLTGGMRSVAAANGLHLVVMYLGTFLALIICIVKLGGASAFSEAAQGLEGDYLSPTAIGGTKISSWVLASLLGACTAQAGIQPVLASKDVKTARTACFYTALVVAPFGVITALLGVCAKLFSEQGTLLSTTGEVVTEAKLALPTLMLNLPPVVGGLVFAAILAAILSTVSPIILSAGTMLTTDLYEVRHPEATERQRLIVTRTLTALCGVICSIGAIGLVNQTMVLDVVYAAYSLRGALFVVLLVGILGKRRNGRAACVSMVLTAIAAVGWTVYHVVVGSYPLFSWFTETYAAILTAAVTMGILSRTMKDHI